MKIINEILLVLKEPDSSNDLIETLTESGINKIEFITAGHDIYAQVKKINRTHSLLKLNIFLGNYYNKFK